MRFFSTLLFLIIFSLSYAASPPLASDPCSYYYETLPHGESFRNAKAFGAAGDGETDDTAAIQRAFDYQQRGGDGSNITSSPAIVYLPPGTYRVTDTLVVWFWGHLIGNPVCPPTLLLPPNTPGFSGVGGMKPLLTASLGFNISAAHHAWWVQGEAMGGHANDLFYVQIHHVRIVCGAGNGGAVGILFPVAQQTSIRGVTIDMTASGAGIGIDFEGGSSYNITYPFGASVGGGGSVEDVSILGGGVGMRLSGSQWSYRGVTITGSTSACLSATSMAWSHTLVGMNLSHCPVAIRSDINGLGALVLLDSILGPGLGPFAIDASGSQGGLYLQAVRVVDPVATPALVANALPTPALGLLHSWGSPTMAASYSGVRVGNGGGGGVFLPLPVASQARAAGVAFACTGSSSSSTTTTATLCGGSDENPSTGLATGATPRPTFVGLPFVSVTTYGAMGDGEADDTAALQAGLASGFPLFLPSGVYKVSDTLQVPCNGTLLGEGLATIALAPNAPGFGGGGNGSGFKAMLSTPPSTPSSPCYAHLADLSLSTLGPGNMGALLLNHTSNSDSGLWDVTIRLYGYGVGLKAQLGPPTPGDPSFSPDSGGGVLSNTWWWVADHNLTDLLPMNNGSAPACTSHCSAGQELGVVVTTGGPLFLMGTNFEHSGQLEYNFTGASNVVGSCIQTEGSTTSVLVDGCGEKGPVVIFGTVFGSGTGGGDNKTLHTTRGRGACVQAGFDAGAGEGYAATTISLDLSFRFLGSMQRLQKNLIVDDAFSIPANATERWDMASIYKTC